ncbi:hypothetical protein D1007_19186 [Hordeum vulgare]|nr:hypothetical protein D1007_19186 [Hordeum vulgare]
MALQLGGGLWGLMRRKPVDSDRARAEGQQQQLAKELNVLELVAIVTSGEESLLFSVEFEHNGIFIGEGMNRSYLYSTIATFDYCHADTWSLSMVKYCLDRLDYSHGFPDLQVYWCLPDKDIVDGLVCVNSEEVIAAMINASKEAKTLLVIVDEENKIRRFYEDVIKDGPPLPDVIISRGAEGGEEEGRSEEENGEGRSEEEHGEGRADADVEQGEERDEDEHVEQGEERREMKMKMKNFCKTC